MCMKVMPKPGYCVAYSCQFKAFNKALEGSFCRTEGTGGILTAIKAPLLPGIIIIMELLSYRKIPKVTFLPKNNVYFLPSY